MNEYVLIKTETLTQLADEIRKLTGEAGALSPAQMIELLREKNATNVNLWDGTLTENMWTSGAQIFRDDATTASAVIPIEPECSYKVVCVEPGDRFRWVTVSSDPRLSNNVTNARRSIFSADTPTEGLEFTFTADGYECYLVGYLGHINTTPGANDAVIEVFRV